MLVQAHRYPSLVSDILHTGAQLTAQPTSGNPLEDIDMIQSSENLGNDLKSLQSLIQYFVPLINAKTDSLNPRLPFSR